MILIKILQPDTQEEEGVLQGKYFPSNIRNNEPSTHVHHCFTSNMNLMNLMKVTCICKFVSQFLFSLILQLCLSLNYELGVCERILIAKGKLV